MRLLSLVAAIVLAGCSQPDSSSSDSGTQAAEAGPRSGEEVYQRSCFSCHAAGLSGAPKTGDADAWGPRIEKGMDVMLQGTIDGIPPAMPAKGLCMDCTDEELMAAIEYMLP